MNSIDIYCGGQTMKETLEYLKRLPYSERRCTIIHIDAMTNRQWVAEMNDLTILEPKLSPDTPIQHVMGCMVLILPTEDRNHSMDAPLDQHQQ